MHNRVRMIVASFLVKHLLISWTEGAKWFWDTLVDADLQVTPKAGNGQQDAVRTLLPISEYLIRLRRERNSTHAVHMLKDGLLLWKSYPLNGCLNHGKHQPRLLKKAGSIWAAIILNLALIIPKEGHGHLLL